jgi:hypothetical protein
MIDTCIDVHLIGFDKLMLVHVMKTILTWLFENTGNAGNYYTILNVQREGDSDSPDSLAVMARRKDFTIVDLLLSTDEAAVPAWTEGRSALETLTFADADEVITYLSQGQTSGSAEAGSSQPIQVRVFSPDEKAGSVTFPPAQS